MLRRGMRLLAPMGLAAAGLAAPLATFFAVAGRGLDLVAAAVAVVSWLALAAYFVEAPRLWPQVMRSRTRWNVAIGPVAVVVGFMTGFYVSYGISIDHDLCGRTSPALVVGAAVYILVAAVGFRWSRAVTAVWVLAPLVAWLVEVGLLFVLPGTRGYCET